MVRLVALLMCACSCGGCFFVLSEDARGRAYNGRVVVAGVVTDADGNRIDGATTVYVHSVRVTGIESLESGAAKVEREDRSLTIGSSFEVEFPDVYQVDLLFRHAGLSDVRRRYRLKGDLWLLDNGRDDWFDRTVVGPSPLVERGTVIRMTPSPSGSERPDGVYVWPRN